MYNLPFGIGIAIVYAIRKKWISFFRRDGTLWPLMKPDGIGHIIWDWNGTLLDDTVASLNTINRMLATRGLSTMDLGQYRDLFGFPIRDCYVKLGFNLEVEAWDAVSREFHSIYMGEAAGVGLRDGIVGLLDRLSAGGKTMSVLSASERTILLDLMTAKGVRSYFKNVYGHSDLFGSSKVELGRRFLRDTAIPPDQILLIGDTDHDYEVARELNCRCILMADGHQSEARLRKCPCLVLQNTAGLAAYVTTMVG